jgi:hypothetical protein
MMAAPAKLTIDLVGLGEATVYLDNEPLPRPAPLRRFPILAGEHKIWVQNDSNGVDHEETIVFHNGEELRMVLPLGASTEEVDGPPPVETSAPRKGRRSRKR